jgi:L,D-transpeptidase YbiS
VQHILIDTSIEQLFLFQDGLCVSSFSISSAKNGLGEQEGSECTPRGWHTVAALIGQDAPVNSVFKARVATGEIYSDSLAETFPGRDWILTRIIRLSGCEPAFNDNSFRRYIYIHGCPDSEPMGEPLSHGCIRMRNADICHLFAKIRCGASVYIF